MKGNQLVIPTLAEIKKYRIVVTTLITSRTLSLMGLECGHFSHIIIDEAAQVKITYRQYEMKYTFITSIIFAGS